MLRVSISSTTGVTNAPGINFQIARFAGIPDRRFAPSEAKTVAVLTLQMVGLSTQERLSPRWYSGR